MFVEEKFKVGIADVTPKGELSDKSILKFFETVACHHSDMAGYGVNDIPRTNLSWVLLNWRVKVFIRPHYGEEVSVRTWARGVSKAFTFRDFVLKNSQGKTMVIASTKWAIIEVGKGLSRITEDIINKYQPENETVFEDGSIARLTESAQGEPKLSYKVLRRDIDINDHVHNLFYLDFAREALPDEFAFCEFDNIEIAYKNGARLGETLDIYYKFENGAHIVTIKNKLTGALNSIVKLQ